MQWSPEISADRSPKGIYIASLLAAYPHAVDAALLEVRSTDVPVDERRIDNIELVRSLTMWLSYKYIEGPDDSERRLTAWRGLHWAYTVARNIPDYIPSLRITSAIVAPEEPDYLELSADSLEASINYGEITDAADSGLGYIDPAGHYPLVATYSSLIGFGAINNNDEKKERWISLEADRLRIDREVIELEHMWAA
jgi:hypothetical protein